MDISQDKSKHW